MKRFDLQTLPHIGYAHSFSADGYRNTLLRKPNTVEITCFSQGTTRLIMADTVYTAREGDFFWNTYGEDLRVECDGRHTHMTVAFGCEFRIVDSDDVTLPAYAGLITPTLGKDSLQALFSKLIHQTHLYPENRMACTGMLLELMNGLGTEVTRFLGNQATGEYHYIRKAKQYIYDHLGEPIRQRDIAAHLGISPSYLCTIFRNSEGCPLMSFINQLKLGHIRSLMEKEHVPLHRAAAMYGYTDPNYVSRLHSKYFGVSLSASMAQGSGEPPPLPPYSSKE